LRPAPSGVRNSDLVAITLCDTPYRNGTGAMSALLVGFVVGMGRLLLEMNVARFFAASSA
jgi:hypothetical protein